MKKIYVVEGKNDVVRLKQIFPNINVVSVNGSSIPKKTMDMLISKNKEYEIVLFTDPDYAGMQIRNKLETNLKNVRHLFINQKDAHNKNRTKIGVEHASDEVIKEAFKNEKIGYINKTDIDIEFLLIYDLVGSKNSNELRNKVSEKLNIGKVNGKQFLNRAKKFGIMQDDVIREINKIKKD